jgi:Planctomycete cytochrome C
MTSIMFTTGYCHATVTPPVILLKSQIRLVSHPNKFSISKENVMKKLSIVKAAVLFLGALIISGSIFQCTKTGDIVKNLDRSFKGSADTAIYASFYDTAKVSSADAVADVNDIIKYRGVKTIIHEYCGTSNCHGGPIKPSFDSYTDIIKYITPGNPQASKIWEYITTNDFNKAMPPVASNHEMGVTDKTLIYNWILNGAKEKPDYKDFRPAAIALITSGCASANCHNEGTGTGGWARAGLLGALAAGDTTQFTYINPQTGASTVYCILSNATKRDQALNAYKDSVRKFYVDTVANASFRPYKTFSTPVSALSTRGPLNTYDDILLDINYPKSVRSNTTVSYTDPVTAKKYYIKGNFLNATSSLITRIDSTLLLANPFTGVYATSQQGDMAYGDGGLKPHEIALIKAWYFNDPIIPDVWKYGQANAGIFKYRKSGNIIKH